MSAAEPSSQPASAERIHPETSIGRVRLTVADLERVRDFYQRAIGLRALESTGGHVSLGADPDAPPIVELVGRPDAPPRPRRSTGLFHQAILVPSRAELARALRRVVDAGWSFSGASDHLVSEALYLNDPEGNGIELYRDRPREEWPRVNGEIQMATVPLELDSLMAELPAGGYEGMPPATRMGHVHLNVADIAASEAFYAGVLGFEVTVRGYPGALFVSAGGYHHHIGMNTWAGEGAPPPPPGSRGLESFEVVLPSRGELDRVAERVTAAGVEAERRGNGLLVADPSANRVALVGRTG